MDIIIFFIIYEVIKVKLETMDVESRKRKGKVAVKCEEENMEMDEGIGLVYNYRNMLGYNYGNGDNGVKEDEQEGKKRVTYQLIKC